MAEGLGKKLKKLEKLDTIESRLNQIHTTLASIEENVSRLDSEVEDLKTKSKQLGSTVNELKESIQFTDEDISDLNLQTKSYSRMLVSSRNNFFTGDLLKEGKCKIRGATRRAS